MEKLQLFNTLKRKKETFKPLNKGIVKMYSCGPTVYWYQHIGNFRTMILNDLLHRTFEYLGYKVDHVMNITDVDDKTIKGSIKEGISLKELTRKYEAIFIEDLASLNIVRPTLVRATENIGAMVEMIKILLKKGFAYKSSDGIYFSIEKFKDYGKLAQLDKIKTKKARIISDEYDKGNAQDFALWKFYSEGDGEVFWDADIGKGRPGWHIECSAMSTKFLGNHFDLHTGAIDLIFPHHTNEIAQSECSSGECFVNYWVHGAFLDMKENKMSKSLGNILTLNTLKEQGYSPIQYRYYCMQTHYRKPLSFNYENLDSAKNAFEKIKKKIVELKKERHKGSKEVKKYEEDFNEALKDDLNLPLALQVFIKLVDDFDIDSECKYQLLKKFDCVLGLGIEEMKEEKFEIPKEVAELVEEREKMRSEKMWAESDSLREKIKERGFRVIDSESGPNVEKI